MFRRQYEFIYMIYWYITYVLLVKIFILTACPLLFINSKIYFVWQFYKKLNAKLKEWVFCCPVADSCVYFQESWDVLLYFFLRKITETVLFKRKKEKKNIYAIDPRHMLAARKQNIDPGSVSK